MQSRALLHAKVPSQAALGKEVCGELNSTAEAGPNHRSPNTTVDTLDTLTSIDLAQTIDGVLIVMLSTDGEEGRIGLQAGLHQEERRSSSRTDNPRCRTGEDINAERLYFGIAVNGIRDVRANGFVKAETAAIKKDLVNVLDMIRALAHIKPQKWYHGDIALLTADPMPRNNPRGPSFWRITLIPCRTPRYFFTPSFFACNSP
jgi:hypothetical protein